MDLGNFGYFGAVGIAAIGSVVGITAASMGAMGAWKKAFMNGKTADMRYLIFAGGPLSQTIYGFIVMLQLRSALDAGVANTTALGMIGILSGLAMASSAIWQGRFCAASCDTIGETGKGLVQGIIGLGLIETIALFVMAFALIQIGVLV